MDNYINSVDITYEDNFLVNEHIQRCRVNYVKIIKANPPKGRVYKKGIMKSIIYCPLNLTLTVQCTEPIDCSVYKCSSSTSTGLTVSLLLQMFTTSQDSVSI